MKIHRIGDRLRLPIVLLIGVASLGTVFNIPASDTDYARSRHVNDWLHHPVLGDPSFDSFERSPGNPIHRGASPFEWPVNGYLFPDPQSGNWYVYVGDYAKGYANPPSRCVLYRSVNRGGTWTNLGVVLNGDSKMFDQAGHTPDVSVVFDAGRYHMVYDWGITNFGVEGGIAYAWADKPEGPWHRDEKPITRNSTLPKLLGRYSRTYAATLLRRKSDWLVVGMMDRAPYSWAMFAMTSPQPGGPYGERRLVLSVEEEKFHPPLMEYFPAFVHGSYVYAPATSVALNRNFQGVFRAPLERAEDPEAWTLFQCGSVWHAEDVENEHYGIWGQTYSGVVDDKNILHVMYPSRDPKGMGTINLAQRPWNKPLRKRGFVLSGHYAPSLTLLRQAYADFELEADLRLRGTASVLLDYHAPLGPDKPTSESSPHALTATRHVAVEISTNSWRLLRRGSNITNHTAVIVSGSLSESRARRLQIERKNNVLRIHVDGQATWAGPIPAGEMASASGVIGLRVEKHSHLSVEQFRIKGKSKPAQINLLHMEAVLGAGSSPEEWAETWDANFRFGIGAVSKDAKARGKWNIFGTNVQLWSPRGPDYGVAEVRLDGKETFEINLHSEKAEPSAPVWSRTGLRDTFHAIALTPKTGKVPLDCLEVSNQR